MEIRHRITVVGAADRGAHHFLRAWTISDSRYDEREAGIRQVVDIAFNLMKEYDERIQKGEFSEAEGKKRYSDRINKMRYNKDDYFWVNDLHPRMVFHPFKKN